MSTLRVTAWSPSRLAKYKECPAKVKYEDLLKMCPVCFKGRISGGFDGEPVVCDTCDDAQPERAPLERGNRLDAALTSDVRGAMAADVALRQHPEGEGPALALAEEAHDASLREATRHPEIAKMVRALGRAKGVLAQVEIAVNKSWARVEWFARDAWGRVKLDVLRLTPKRAIIIDWKSGNIDKKTHQIREKPEYYDSMRLYQIAVLSTHPQAEASAMMAFLDAPPKLDNPFKELPILKRKDLQDAKVEMEAKLLPLMSDTTFGPRPGYYCTWCSFAKKCGGPCPFGER